jgi:hypothetical protein
MTAAGRRVPHVLTNGDAATPGAQTVRQLRVERPRHEERPSEERPEASQHHGNGRGIGRGIGMGHGLTWP